MNKVLFRLLSAFLLSSLLAACGGGGATSPTPASSSKAITGFAFTSPTATGVIDEGAKTIAVTVPYGTNVTGLVATFTTSGTSVKVGATTQVSAVTPNNFTNPVVYTVTALDASTVDYTVTVTIALNSAKAITGFVFTSPTATGVIDEGAKTIAVTVPYGTAVTGLVATFTTSGASVKVGATTQVSAVTPNNFTNPVVYTVTAADGSTATYTVTVAAPYELTLYDFESGNSSPQTVSAQLTASDFISSGTATFLTGNGSFYAISQTTWNVPLGTTYFEFTMAAVAGYELLPKQLSFDSMRSSTGPTNWQVLIDPGTGWAEVGTGATAAALTWGTTTLDLSGYGPYTGSVSFRITATGASASGGTWRIDNVSPVGYVNPL